MIDLSFLKGKKIGVVGLGKTGKVTVSALKNAEVDYKTYDDKVNPDKDFLIDLDMIVWSPGIDFNVHPIAIEAREKNIEIICDIELLYRACPNAFYLGVTGTNGKSTTVSLMYHILQSNGVLSQLGGNIGNPAMSLDMLDENGIYVIELSSYQLELINDMKFYSGGVLNLSQDHLERHKTLENYMNIKGSLLEKSKIKFISIDDDYCREFSTSLKDKNTISVMGNDANIIVKNGVLKDFDLTIMKVDDLEFLKGIHNYQNIAFAYAMIRNSTKLSVEAIVKSIKTFTGLKHRQQLVRVIENIRFINDSKATNCDASSTALSTYDNILWIVGGQSKEGGFSSLSKFLPKINTAYVIGECEQELIDFFKDNSFSNYKICKTLDAAVKKCAEDASSGDIVLLSPACASWDQFSSFEHRGDEFIRLVEEL
ncbi:MAG: UDP-N-acetylmuramoyl-L-alanine--D-glutamate ligase [Alphaproteobacteria bacterium]|nr:UDP-N-acetylmuramoyl-L-alanine--D-glutamate ligase [Alphaproteobacteria bacterium]